MKLKSYLLLVAAVSGQAMPPTPTLISMPPMPTSTGAIKTPKIAPPPMPTTFDLLDPDFNLDDLDKAMKDLDQLDAALKDLDTAMKDLASLNNTGDFNITSSFNTTIPDSIDEDDEDDEVDIGLIIETMMKVEGLMERIDPKDVASLDIKGKTNSEIIALATEKFGEKDPIVEVLTALDDIDIPLAEYINKMEIPEKNVISQGEKKLQLLLQSKNINGQVKGKFKIEEIIKLAENSLGSIYSNYQFLLRRVRNYTEIEELKL